MKDILSNRLKQLNSEVDAMRDEFNSTDDKSVKKMVRDAISNRLTRIAEVELLLGMMPGSEPPPQLNKHDVLSCKELLFQMGNEQIELMQPGMAEVQIKEAFKNLNALAAVKKLIEERQSL